MFEVLLQVAAAMKAGLAVTVAPHRLMLSTQEAADLLGIARTTLVRLAGGRRHPLRETQPPPQSPPRRPDRIPQTPTHRG
ncbi:helix-turn-helix domain-containing protein [Frankia sp. AiPs1]|uniref:helix-turn-helix domain-containing protein n=1 Tax=Frankia sp. AiPs1 TaxID=573493 RepID=UPI002043DAC7|nr:helix-turn-helix domain-containing protein [Frankia sp. AiPs1]MCM3920196.1 helix-turn-helix domain-containing protein [Frankia sp. AiPs1]